jgi:hypothetical protein
MTWPTVFCRACGGFANDVALQMIVQREKFEIYRHCGVNNLIYIAYDLNLKDIN